MQVMVLAAGLGTRLWPLTLDRAKPAVPFAGRPLIAGVVDHLVGHGITDVVVNTHYRPASIQSALEGRSDTTTLRFSHEDVILGTAGGLAKARDEGLLDPDVPTMIFNGKLVTDIDLSAVVAAHQRSGAAVTMVLLRNRAREHFREVLIEGDRVSGFGQTREPEGDDPLLFTGIHVIEPEVLRAIPTGVGDTIRQTYPPLIAARRVHAHLASESRWWEFSTPERYVSLHRRAQSAGLVGSVSASAGARIHASAVVENVIAWENAGVSEGCSLTDVVLGANVVLPEGLQLARTVVVRADLAPEIARGQRRGDLLYVPLEGARP